jgi:hypothetical protein
MLKPASPNARPFQTVNLHRRFGLLCPILLLACLSPCLAQQPDQAAVPTPNAQATAKPSQSVTPGQTKPPDEPYILEDGGLSIEPMYWLNRAQPTLRGGVPAAASLTQEGLDYFGTAKNSVGGELSMPAGRSNSLRISYFRVQGNSNTTEAQTVSLFGEGYSPGDYLNSHYTLQSAKISWDYLGYTWHKRSGAIRLKTLYEVQYATISTTVFAPFKPLATDSSGNTDTNVASGGRFVLLPTLGLELEEALGHHFRWELKGSGFGIPHRADIWDAEATLALRLHQFELLAGEKAFHFKTSPQNDEYFADTLSGAYVGIRYYWGKTE